MHKVFTLSNGIRVVTEFIDYVKSVSAGVWVGAGSSFETLENNGVSHFIEHMMFKGTTSRTAKEIAEFMDSVGGQLNAVTGKEYTCYYSKTLSEHLEMSFEILSDMVRNSTFTNENMDIERKVIVEEINMGEDDPEDYIHDILSKNMWKNSALGYPIAGTTQSLSKIDRRAILDYYNDIYVADNIVISVVGNFDEEMALRLLEEKFGGIKEKGRKFDGIEKLSVEKSAVVVKKDIEQCQLCLGFEGFCRGDRKVYDLAVVNALFGGNMSSRLFQKVREESGLAYSVYSYSSSYQNNGSMIIYAGLNAESLYRALEIINREIDILKKDKLTRDEINTAKAQLKASMVMGSEGVSSRMRSYGKGVLFENRAKTLDEIIDLIDGVSFEGVSEVIERVFDRNHLTVAALGRLDTDGKEMLDILNF